jgi:ketosteroid isomerase-like protein
MDIERRIRQLEDRVEIGELIARYGLVMDDRDVAGMPALFTPDIVIRSDDGVLDVSGLEGAVKMFCGRFAVLGPSNHVTHDRIITFDEADPDRATGIVLSHAEMNRKGAAMVAAIRYHDAYQRHEGRWKFAARRLSFFYYVSAAEYADALGAGLALRNRAYEHPSPADWPERLERGRSGHGAERTG